jgi:hypothetical protein
MSKESQLTCIQKSMPAETWARFREVRVLRRAEEDPGTSVRRIAAAEGIGVPLAWRTLHPYHIQRVQALTPPDHRAVQGWYFASGFSQNALQTHSL